MSTLNPLNQYSFVIVTVFGLLTLIFMRSATEHHSADEEHH